MSNTIFYHNFSKPGCQSGDRGGTGGPAGETEDVNNEAQGENGERADEVCACGSEGRVRGLGVSRTSF